MNRARLSLNFKNITAGIVLASFIAGFLFAPNPAIADTTDNSAKLSKYDQFLLLNILHSNLAPQNLYVDYDVPGTTVGIILFPLLAKEKFVYMMEIWSTEVINIAIKLARIYLSNDIEKFLLDEIEQMPIKEAKEKLLEVLADNKIKIGGGLLKGSFTSYTGNNLELAFPYIIEYQSLDDKQGEIVMQIRSSEPFEAPKDVINSIIVGDAWREKEKKIIKPFIVTVAGTIKKPVCVGDGYTWVNGRPDTLTIEFPGYVEDIQPPAETPYILEESSEWVLIIGEFLEKIRDGASEAVKKEVEDIQTAWEGIKNFFSQLKLYAPAALTGNPLLRQSNPITEDDEVWSDETENEETPVSLESGSITESTSGTEIENSIIDTQLAQTQNQTDFGFSISDIVEKLDDLNEEVDILSQKIANLIGSAAVDNSQPIDQELDETEDEIGELATTTKKIVEGNVETEDAIFEDEEQEEVPSEQQENVTLAGAPGIVDRSLPPLLISEVAAGWDDAKNEFIEIYNPNNTNIALNSQNFKLKLVNSSDKTTNKRLNWSSSIIPASGRFLFAAGKIELDNAGLNPDATFAAQLTNVSGVIISDGDGTILDQVAWGECLDANCGPDEKSAPSAAIEGQGMVLSDGLETNYSLDRKSDGTGNLIDSNDNSQDFFLQNQPNPENSKGKTLVRPVPTAPPAPEPGSPIQLSTSTLIFRAEKNSANPPNETIILENIGTTSLSWSVSSNYPTSSLNWLATSPATGTLPTASSTILEFLVDITDLDIGNYRTTSTITSDKGDFTAISVNLAITGPETPLLSVVINEVAWMGTTASANDEWIELYNNTTSTIDLTGWTLASTDSSPNIALDGSIPPNGFYLMERTASTTIIDIQENQTYTGALIDAGEKLALKNASNALIDVVDCSIGWFSGDKNAKISMERIDSSKPGSEATNWANNDSNIASQGHDAQNNPILGTPKTANSTALTPRTIWVDDIFQDDPISHQWNTVQKAINDARANDTIIVKEGQYAESLIVDKPNINIISESGKTATTLGTPDSQKPVMTVKADGLTLQGFTVSGFGAEGFVGQAGLRIEKANNCLITDNHFSRNNQAIYMATSTNNTLDGNTFRYNVFGVYLENSATNTITNNTVFSKHNLWNRRTCGIALDSSNHNVIGNNTTNDEIHGDDVSSSQTHGICLEKSNNNTIQGNSASDNGIRGASTLGAGIYLENSQNNAVSGNLSNDNSYGIELLYSNDNDLLNNISNDKYVGIKLTEANTNLLKSNNISYIPQASERGIGISLSNASNNILRDNTMINSNFVLWSNNDNDLNNDMDITNTADGKPIYYLVNQSGVVIDNAANPAQILCIHCDNITVQNVTITDPPGNTGIFFYKTTDSTVKNSNISGAKYGILLDHSGNNTISDNALDNNGRSIDLNNSNYNDIVRNIIADSNAQYISVSFALGLGASLSNNIHDNTMNNSPTGLYIAAGSSQNTFSGNAVENNAEGVMISCSSDNLFFHNNFINNASNRYGHCSGPSVSNKWHDSITNEGNYYSDYDEPIEGCENLDSNKFCDAPYSLPQDDDLYPFIQPNGWLAP